MVRECKATNVSCISFSGYAGKSVWGYPVSASGNNCVNYVAYRLARNGVAQQSTMGNGGSWATNAAKRGFRVDKVATVGSVAQWNYGSSYAPSHGHVGYVEEVTSAYLVISDSSYGGGYSSRWRVPRGRRQLAQQLHPLQGPALPPAAVRRVPQGPRDRRDSSGWSGKTPTRVVSTTGLGTVTPYLVSSHRAGHPPGPRRRRALRPGQRARATSTGSPAERLSTSTPGPRSAGRSRTSGSTSAPSTWPGPAATTTGCARCPRTARSCATRPVAGPMSSRPARRC